MYLGIWAKAKKSGARRNARTTMMGGRQSLSLHAGCPNGQPDRCAATGGNALSSG
ncbi:hypothetical protein B0G77_5734 [Paraburkholderia sp. BL10I2N1]|nr:hypothetical protein B0G77_5734 [Paraburkholderia sp. BL10I2N1]